MDKVEVIRCSSCGSVEIETISNSIAKCSHCGSTMIMPKQNGEIVAMLNNAYVYRANFNYDLAIKSYQFVLEKDSNELSAYEGILLAEYGIEYVKDSYSGKLVPTCHRAHFTSIYDNEYYKTLITLANDDQKIVINNKVKEIDKLQKAIERQLKNEQEYDIFISYKATDENGDVTEDALIAREIYEELISKNYKVFFAEKSLENRVGAEYEPIIFKALHTSKIFILVGTKKENVEANWVRNEWSRYVDRIKNEEKLSKSSFIPVFKNMNPYDMPKVNNAYVQGVDASKLGYLVTLTDGISKLLKPEKEQKVLQTFENLDNFEEFARIQKQKHRELKERNWKNFTKTKGVKKWLHYALIFAPTLLSILYLVLSVLPDSQMKRGKTFVLFHIVFVMLIAVSIVALCLHAKRFRVNKIINSGIPFGSLAVGFVMYLLLFFFNPVTICGVTMQQIGSASCYRDGGFYYSKSWSGYGSDLQTATAHIEYFDSNNEYKKYIKNENGKNVFYLPTMIGDVEIESFSAKLPTDIDIIVLPKDKRININGYIDNFKHLDAIYCYDISLNGFNLGVSMYDKNSLPFPIYYQIGEETMYPDFVKVDNIKYYK